MKYSTQIRPISYLKSHAADIVKNLSELRQPMLITQNGEAKLAILDIESYEEYEEMLATFKLLAMGNQAIEKGEGRSADDVFKEFDNV